MGKVHGTERGNLLCQEKCKVKERVMWGLVCPKGHTINLNWLEKKESWMLRPDREMGTRTWGLCMLSILWKR